MLNFITTLNRHIRVPEERRSLGHLCSQVEVQEKARIVKYRAFYLEETI